MTPTLQGLRFLLLVILTGIVAGLGAIFFRDLIGFFHNLLFYGEFSTTYDVLQHAKPSRFGIGIILIPVIGAIGVAYLVKNFAPEAKGHGVPEVMDAIYYEHSKVRPIVALVKALASSLSIGSGGSVGREGPIIQIGAAFGSALGQWIKLAEWERGTLVACGAGGGIAATFNTPLGGILFALELILPEVSARTILPVILATAIATYTSYLAFGDVTFIPFATNAIIQLNGIGALSAIFFGIVLGFMSMLFIHSIYYIEDLFERIPYNYYVQHMFGMFLVGVSLYCMLQLFGHYYVQGVGYATVVDVLDSILNHPGFLLLLALVKIVDTSLTLGSGGSGGIFSPLLFIGATLGGAFASALTLFFPNYPPMNIQLGALAGMAGMVGASTGAPITAILMTAELTNDFTIILPLMIIVTIACIIRRILLKDTIYTLKLSRRGHHIPLALTTGLWPKIV